MVSNGADIQIERGGFTRIHNAILEQLAHHDLSSREYACILYLLRMTYGFNRKDCQLSNGDFAKATNIERPAVIKTLRRLVERNVFHKAEGDPYHAATWSFNKYFEQWDAQTSVKTITSAETTTSQIDTTSSYQDDTTSAIETTTSYISAKDNKDNSKDEGKDSAAPVASADYFGMKKPYRAERVTADGYIQDAAREGVDAPTFVGIFNALIDAAGWRALVDAGDDNKLNFAKKDALMLVRIGAAKNLKQVAALIEAFRAANPRRAADPRNIAEYASQLQAGVMRPAQTNGYTPDVISPGYVMPKFEGSER